MNQNILFFEDNLRYLSGQYRHGLRSLRSIYPGESICALILTRSGKNLSPEVRHECDIEEKICPATSNELKQVLDDFALSNATAIHIVYLQDNRPVAQAIANNSLPQLCENYSIVVVDWKYDPDIEGDQIIDVLDSKRHLLIPCSAEFGKLTKKYDRKLVYRGVEKAKAYSDSGPDLLAVLISALSVVRRGGKSWLLVRSIGDHRNPLGVYVHPATTWKPEYYEQRGQMQMIVDSAEHDYKSYLSEALEEEEQEEFTGSSSLWSFERIKAIVNGEDAATVKDKVETLLDGGLKSRFRVDFTSKLLKWAEGNTQLQDDLREMSLSLPPGDTAFLYAGGIDSLLALVSEVKGAKITKSHGSDGWTKHVISLTQRGWARDGEAKDNGLLISEANTLLKSFAGEERDADLAWIRRLVSSYGPLLFERYNAELNESDRYLAIRMEGRRIEVTSAEQLKEEFERAPLNSDTANASKQVIRFSFLFWMFEPTQEPEPAMTLPDRIKI